VAVNNENFLRPDISDSCVTSLVRVLFLVFSYIILESECKLEERIFFNCVLCAVQKASHHGGISLNQLVPIHWTYKRPGINRLRPQKIYVS
jgi:hypothetical protein